MHGLAASSVGARRSGFLRAVLATVVAASLVGCGTTGPSSSAVPTGSGAPASTEPTAPPEPTELILNMTHSLEAKGHFATSGPDTTAFWGSVFEPLARYVEGVGVVGVLAKSWEAINPTTWRFTLYEEATFADGTPVTAEDVAFTFDRMKNDPTSLVAGLILAIEEVVVVDAHTFDIKTDGPRADLVGPTIMGRGIMSKAYLERLGLEAADETPMGSGPYELVEWLPAERYVLELRDDYWGTEVNPDGCPACTAGKAADRVVYRFIQEPEVQVTALLNGEIDVTSNIPLQLVERVENSADHYVATSLAEQHAILILNPVTPPLQDIRVRQAIWHAIDTQSIIDGPLSGAAVKLDGPVGPTVIGYDPDLPKRAFDQDEARRLMTEAGYPDGFDVDLSCPNGSSFLPNEPAVCAAITDMLEQVGIRVNERLIEFATYNTENRENKYHMWFQAPTATGGDPTLFDSWLACESGRSSWCNEEWEDAYLSRQPAETNLEERIRILQEEVWPIMVEEVPAVPLWQAQLYRALANNVKVSYPTDATEIVPTTTEVE